MDRSRAIFSESIFGRKFHHSLDRVFSSWKFLKENSKFFLDFLLVENLFGVVNLSSFLYLENQTFQFPIWNSYGKFFVLKMISCLHRQKTLQKKKIKKKINNSGCWQIKRIPMTEYFPLATEWQYISDHRVKKYLTDDQISFQFPHGMALRRLSFKISSDCLGAREEWDLAVSMGNLWLFSYSFERFLL